MYSFICIYGEVSVLQIEGACGLHYLLDLGIELLGFAIVAHPIVQAPHPNNVLRCSCHFLFLCFPKFASSTILRLVFERRAHYFQSGSKSLPAKALATVGSSLLVLLGDSF